MLRLAGSRVPCGIKTLRNFKENSAGLNLCWCWGPQLRPPPLSPDLFPASVHAHRTQDGSFYTQGWPHPSPAHPLWLPSVPGQNPSPSACSSPTVAHQIPRFPCPWHHPKLWALHPWYLLCHSHDHCSPHCLCPSLWQVSLSETKGPGLTPPGSPASPTTGEVYERSGSPFSSA